MTDRAPPHLTPDDLDLAVAGRASAEVEAHLLGCASCRAIVDDERQVQAALRALPRMAPRRGFADGVMARLPISAHLDTDALDLVLEGQPTPAAIRHLAQCADCRELVAFERELVPALAALAPVAPRAGFADRVLARLPIAAHLTGDALDLVLAGRPSLEVARHLERCADCRELVALERTLVQTLAMLPAEAPRPGFADRVVASLAAQGRLAASARRWWQRPAALAASAAAVAGMGASAAWTLANQAALRGIAATGLAAAREAGEVALAWASSSAATAPIVAWVERGAAVSWPLALAAAGVSLAYLGGLVALRRLLAVPTTRVAHATLH